MDNFVEKQPYAGEIVGQKILEPKNGDKVKVVLSVLVKGVCTRDDPTKVVSEFDYPVEKDVWLDFPAGDPDKISWRLNDLSKLGFDTDKSILTLDEGHPDHQSLIGTACAVTVKRSEDGEREFWNLFGGFDKGTLNDDGMAMVGKVLDDDVMKEARKRLKERRENRQPADVAF